MSWQLEVIKPPVGDCPKCWAECREASAHFYFSQNKWAYRCKACRHVFPGSPIVLKPVEVGQVSADQPPYTIV